MLLLLSLGVQDTRGGELCPAKLLPNFRKQSVCLVGTTVLDPPEGKINENEEPTIFT